jgi:hypothetical protein
MLTPENIEELHSIKKLAETTDTIMEELLLKSVSIVGKEHEDFLIDFIYGSITVEQVLDRVAKQKTTNAVNVIPRSLHDALQAWFIEVGSPNMGKWESENLFREVKKYFYGE